MRGAWIVAALMFPCVDAPTGAWRLDPVVSESSGLVASQRWHGIYWTHNDSGDGPRLFAITGDGALVREVPVEGAAAVDWEEITLDDAGHLWIADSGNNANTRLDLTLYRVPEPDPKGSGPVTVDRVVRFRYPDQGAFPDPLRLNFDAEAMFHADDTLWVLTKHRSDLDTTLYRFPATEGEVVLERAGSYTLGGDRSQFGGMATAASLHPSGRFLAVLAYHAIFVFERPLPGEDWLSRPVNRITLDQDVAGQCEGIAWDGWSLVFTNEARAVHRVPAPFTMGSWP